LPDAPILKSPLQSARVVVFAALVAVGLAASVCAPRRVVLPTGPGTPRLDASTLFEQATTACRSVRTMTAELNLSGRAAGQRLRGRVQVGLVAPAAVYLEAPAPFGAAGFILAAQNERGRLLLPRDRVVVNDALVSEILEALTGLKLGPRDLRALLTGCVAPDPVPQTGREYVGGWVAVDLQGGSVAWLRQLDAVWRVVAGEHAGLVVEHGSFGAGAGVTPREVRVRSASAASADVDLRVELSQVELNVPLDAATFKVDVPPGTREITADELRAHGPLSQP
jgi:hypothetical protein